MMSNERPTVSILGAGWLGLPLGRYLVEKGYAVKGSTTRAERLAELEAAGLQPFLLRVGEQIEGEWLESFFASDILILNIPPGRRREDVAAEHPREVRRVYELAVAGGVQHLLFISSTGVYGDLNRVVTEADAPDPDRASGRALAAIETFLRRQTAIEPTILRLAGLVGGERKAGRFLAGKRDLPGGDAPVNLVHLDDCIGVIYEIIRQEKWGEIYNVCADEHPPKRSFYPAQAEREGLEPPTFRDDGKAPFKIISNEKVKVELGYAFRHPDPMGF